MKTSRGKWTHRFVVQWYSSGSCEWRDGAICNNIAEAKIKILEEAKIKLFDYNPSIPRIIERRERVVKE